jgi:alpha-L-rhamnosidase
MMKKNKLLSDRFRWLILIIAYMLNTAFTEIRKESKMILLSVSQLKCEYAVNPVGLDIQSPQLSWQIESVNRGILQIAYQVKVADSPENLVNDIGNVWDSDTVLSSISAGIKYNGAELKSRKGYYWKVRIMDSNQKMSDWSEPAFFEMGLMD